MSATDTRERSQPVSTRIAEGDHQLIREAAGACGLSVGGLLRVAGVASSRAVLDELHAAGDREEVEDQ